MHNYSVSEPVLVVDIGNTNIVCAIYQQGNAVWTCSLQSQRERTSDEYYSLLSGLLKDINLKDIPYVALGSVVPELARIWKHLITKYAKAVIYEINGLSPLGLTYKSTNPGTVGADLVANAYAVWKKYEHNSIVIDLGTATTIQVVSSKGIFEGAIIAPGIKTGASGLWDKAAQLYELELILPPALLGRNTHDAVLSGVIHGHALMLEAFINRLKLQYFDYSPIQTILCGGLATLVHPLIASIDIIDKSLTLDGFYMAFNHLRQSQNR
ncbi:MAG: type III pantothenate kinase [Candidatus Cloacimonetes bacterium HGW-Cloacimonetes-3]|jgi:type III pantothenate kinase|nr:MAG: type III pantothenate kinase [Candidatus Cloacimonetes bacterium HGW-Cloacimonetes-3]